jgi:hypothetical protein
VENAMDECFWVDQKSKTATITGHSFYMGLYWKMKKISAVIAIIVVTEPLV